MDSLRVRSLTELSDGGRGWQLEADPRHAELIVEQLGLDTTKGLSTPGIDEDDMPEVGDDELLTGADITLFRGLAAQCTYLSMDRADLQYAAK